MKLATSFAALAAGMLALGACSDDRTASDSAYRDTQEARRDQDLYQPQQTLPPIPLPPTDPNSATPVPPTPGAPPPPLPPT